VIRYLVDTNVVSMLDPRRRPHARALVDWIDRNGARIFLSVTTIVEMDAGILKLRREGKMKRADQLGFLVSSILEDFADRILPMDLETGRHLAQLGERTHRQPIALPDLIIAATAVRHGLVLLTRNLGELGRLAIDARDPFIELPEDP
jgi:predicted nucleic acid-binding protein